MYNYASSCTLGNVCFAVSFDKALKNQLVKVKTGESKSKERMSDILTVLCSDAGRDVNYLSNPVKRAIILGYICRIDLNRA